MEFKSGGAPGRSGGAHDILEEAGSAFSVITSGAAFGWPGDAGRDMPQGGEIAFVVGLARVADASLATGLGRALSASAQVFQSKRVSCRWEYGSVPGCGRGASFGTGSLDVTAEATLPLPDAPVSEDPSTLAIGR